MQRGVASWGCNALSDGAHATREVALPSGRGPHLNDGKMLPSLKPGDLDLRGFRGHNTLFGLDVTPEPGLPGT
jgi:hypothetical protein